MLLDSDADNDGLQNLREHAAHSAFERVKDWVERRLFLRREVNVSVLVLQGTRVQSGILIDVSDDGFGLNKVHGVIADEFISVATPEGHILEGRVLWAEGMRAGVYSSRRNSDVIIRYGKAPAVARRAA